MGYVNNNLDCDDTNLNYKQWVFRDNDSDGYGDSNSKICTILNPIPNGYVDNNFDCNDSSVSQNLLKENFKDQDSDGYGTSEVVGYSCGSASVGTSLNKTDCDDANANNYRQLTLYRDSDGDTYGTGAPQILCVGLSNPANYVASSGDCNDSNSNIYLSQYLDQDADGYGAGGAVACTNATIQSGKSFVNTDCNDADSAKKVSWNVYSDNDGDGQGAGSIQSTCGGLTIPSQKSINNSDCDDTDSFRKNFSGYTDYDLDSFGASSLKNVCDTTMPTYFVNNNSDCDDNDKRAWKEIFSFEDDDNDGKGSLSSLIKSCAGKTKNIMHVSNNLDHFPKDQTRYLSSSLPSSSSAPNGAILLDEATAIPSLTDLSGNYYVVNRTGLGNYCDPNTSICNTYASLCEGSNGSKCLVIQKKNSSNAIVWQKLIRTSTGYIYTSNISKLTQSQDLIVLASFTGSVDLDPNAGVVAVADRPVQYSGQESVTSFILKLSSAGNYLDHKKTNAFLSINDASLDVSTNNYWIFGNSYFANFYSINEGPDFIGILNDDLTFSPLFIPIPLSNGYSSCNSSSKFLKITSLLIFFQCDYYSSNSNNIMSKLVLINRTTNLTSTMPITTTMARSTTGKIFSIKDGVSYELTLATGLIEVKTSQPLFVTNVLYDINNNIVFAGSGYSKCNKVDNICTKPTQLHDWNGLDDYYQFIIINQKNYFWKTTLSSILNLKSVDEQTFIVNGIMPQLSGGMVPLLYSDVSKTQNTSSAFNINKGFTWSYKH